MYSWCILQANWQSPPTCYKKMLLKWHGYFIYKVWFVDSSFIVPGSVKKVFDGFKELRLEKFAKCGTSQQVFSNFFFSKYRKKLYLRKAVKRCERLWKAVNANVSWFVYDCSRKTLYSIKRPNFIFWLPLLLEVWNNMCIVITCCPVCQAVFFLPNQNVRTKM